MDDLRFYVLFNSISVIAGRCLDDNERLCAMDRPASPTESVEYRNLASTLSVSFLYVNFRIYPQKSCKVRSV